MPYVRMSEYCTLRNISENVLYVKVNTVKKETGKLPDWYKKEKHIAYVDMYYLDFLIGRKEACVSEMTNPIYGVYWYLKLYYTNYQISTHLSAMSRKYKDADSWMHFISNVLFNVEDKKMMRFDWSLKEDFFLIGCRLLYRTAKQFGLRELSFD